MTKRRCLLLDDDAIAATFVAELLRARGIQVDQVADIATADARRLDYDWLLVDRRLPDGDGIDWLRRVLQRALAPAAQRCLIISGDSLLTSELPPEVSTLRKPIDADVLLAWLDGSAGAVAAASIDDVEPTARLPLLEDDAAIRRLGGRRESLLALRSMLHKELIEGTPWQAALSEATARKQSLGHLHRLRAACALTGCLQLAEYSTAIEEVLRSGALPKAALLDGFRRCLADTIAQITGCG